MRLASGQPPSAPLVPLPASLNTRHAELSLIASVPPSHRSINSKLTSHNGQQRSTRGERGSSVESSVQDPTKHSRSGGGASYVTARGRMGHHHGGCRCELCGAPAAVHCAADAAFLCAACDAKVHGANFLASRHRRTRLLDLAAAAGAPAPDEEDGYESAAASSCVSTADSASSSAPPRRRRPRGARAPAGRPMPSSRAEAVLEAWAKRAGLAAGPAALRRAARALRACAHDLASARVPPRVAMAAALWREVAGRSGGGIGGGGCGLGEALRRLEACAHVPARLVVAVAASLARALGRARRRRRAATDAVEGWDECAWAGPRSSPARS